MVKWHIPVPGWRVWDDRQKQWRKATADERSSVGGSRGAILPVAPFCQIRYRADVPRVSLPSISMDQLVKPLFGFWVTSARRRNFLWPLYLEDMGDDRESVLSAWQRISRLQTLPFPAYAVCDFENDLPEIIMERLRTKAFTGDPPTKKSFSTEFPTADMVLPNCDFLLSDSDPFVLDFVSKYFAQHDEQDLSGMESPPRPPDHDEDDEGAGVFPLPPPGSCIQCRVWFCRAFG